MITLRNIHMEGDFVVADAWSRESGESATIRTNICTNEFEISTGVRVGEMVKACGYLEVLYNKCKKSNKPLPSESNYVWT